MSIMLNTRCLSQPMKYRPFSGQPKKFLPSQSSLRGRAGDQQARMAVRNSLIPPPSVWLLIHLHNTPSKMACSPGMGQREQRPEGTDMAQRGAHATSQRVQAPHNTRQPHLCTHGGADAAKHAGGDAASWLIRGWLRRPACRQAACRGCPPCGLLIVVCVDVT